MYHKSKDGNNEDQTIGSQFAETSDIHGLDLVC